MYPNDVNFSQYVEVYDHMARSDSQFLYSTAARDFGRARQIFESVLATPPPPGKIDFCSFNGSSERLVKQVVAY
jgi:hypothetical protein